MGDRDGQKKRSSYTKRETAMKHIHKYIFATIIILLLTSTLQSGHIVSVDSLHNELEALQKDCKQYLKDPKISKNLKAGCQEFNVKVNKAFKVGYQYNTGNGNKFERYVGLMNEADESGDWAKELISLYKKKKTEEEKAKEEKERKTKLDKQSVKKLSSNIMPDKTDEVTESIEEALRVFREKKEKAKFNNRSADTNSSAGNKKEIHKNHSEVIEAIKYDENTISPKNTQNKIYTDKNLPILIMVLIVLLGVISWVGALANKKNMDRNTRLSLNQKLWFNIYSLLGFSYFSRKDADKVLNPLFNTKVQSPYDPTKTVLLIDVIANTSLSAKAINKVFNSYGIEYSKEAIDITGKHGVEYMQYHGQSFHYVVKDNNLSIDDSGAIERVPDILPIITNSHLDKMKNLIQNQNESFGSFYGHASEFAASAELQKAGYQVQMPTDPTTKGYDLLVEKKFFNEHSLIYTEHPQHSGYGLLQVKSTSSLESTQNFTDNTLDHFQKFPDIPVLASAKITDNLSTIPKSKIISFENIGMDEQATEKLIYAQLLAVKDLHGQELIDNLGLPQGLNVSQLDSVTNASELFGDIGANSIPMIGIILTASFSSYTNFKKIKSGDISFAQGIKNIGTSSSKTAVIGTASIATTQALVGGVLNTTSGAVLFEGAETMHEHFLNPDLDWDMPDLEDMAELALVVATIYYVGKGVKKLWEAIAGDPFEAYKNLYAKLDIVGTDITTSLRKHTNKILKLLGMDYVKSLTNEIDKINAKMQKIYVEYTFGTQGTQSLQYYLFEYKKKFLESNKEEFSLAIDLQERILRVLKVKNLLLKNSGDKKDFHKNEFIHSILSNYESTDEAYYKIRNMFQKAGGEQKDIMATCKMILEYEINIQADLYTKLLKGNNELVPLYNSSQSYMQLKSDIKQEVKSLKDKGHIKS